MNEGSLELPKIRNLTSEFADPQIEKAYRQMEVQQYGRFVVIGLGALILLTFLVLGITLDVTFFTGEARRHLTLIIGYRISGLVVFLLTIWWISRRLRPNAFYHRMFVFFILFTVWYVGLAYLYSTLSGLTQNRFWFSLFTAAIIVGTTSPTRYALLGALPLFPGALILNAFLLNAGLATTINVLVLMLGSGAVATYVVTRLNRGRRLAYAYRENLRRINQQLQQEIEKRTAVENELRRHREHLEEMVRERTAEKSILEAQLFQVQKIEALGRLAGGVAHDFNNLLIPILNYAEMTQQSMAEDDPLRKGVGLISVAAGKAADLTRQLLAYSRKQAIKGGVVDVHQLIDNYRDMLIRLIREDIKIEILAEAERSLIRGDESQLGQILINMAVNAADAMPSGGRFSIRTSNRVLADPNDDLVVSGQLASGNYLVIEIRDTGLGIHEDVLGHIFEPFFTTKERNKGTGLGLSMVFGIVKQHGGHITVDSAPGQGSLFRIFLPLSGEQVARESGAEPIPEPASGQTVLIVEDEEMVRTLLINILESKGYHLLVAADGDEAIRLSVQHPDEIHLLLTDLILPRMNGRQIFERINQARRGIRVLYTSGYTNDVIGQHGVLEEGTVFIQKPFTADQLLRKVGEALARPVTGP